MFRHSMPLCVVWRKRPRRERVLSVHLLGYVMCSVYIFGGLIFCHNEYLFMSSSKSRAAFCSKNNQTDDLIWYSLGSIQYMQLDSLAWSVTNKHIHDIFLKWHVSAILIFWSYYAVSTLTIILKTFYAISRQLIIYRDKSSLLLQSSSRRLPGVFLWLLGDWWLQDLLESAAEATRPPCSAGVGMLAGWACPTRRSSRVDWSAARLPAWAGLVRRVSRDGKQSSLHSNTAPRSVQSVWRRRLLENKIFLISKALLPNRNDHCCLPPSTSPVAIFSPSKLPAEFCILQVKWPNEDSAAVKMLKIIQW